MLQTTLAFELARQRPDALPVVAYVLETDLGSRLYTSGAIPGALSNADGAPFDAETYLDGDVGYFDAGQTFLEVLPRVVEWGAIDQRTVPLGTELLVALGNAERAGFSVRLGDGGNTLAAMLATEYVHRRIGRVLVGFAGLEIGEYIEPYRGRVTRWTLDASSLLIEHLEQ